MMIKKAANFIRSIRTFMAMVRIEKDVLEKMKEAAKERLSLFTSPQKLTDLVVLAVVFGNMKASMGNEIDPLEAERESTRRTIAYVESLNITSLDEQDARLVVRAMVNWINRQNHKSREVMEASGYATIRQAAAISDAVQTCLRGCESYREAENAPSQELLSKVRDIRVLPWLAFDDFRRIFEEKLVDLAVSGLLQQTEIAALKKVAYPVLSSESLHGVFKFKRTENDDNNNNNQPETIAKQAPVIIAVRSPSNALEDISVRMDEENAARKSWERERNNLQDSMALFTDTHFMGALTSAFSKQRQQEYLRPLQENLSASLTMAYYNAALEILAASDEGDGNISDIQQETSRFATLSDQLMDQADQIDHRAIALGEMIGEMIPA